MRPEKHLFYSGMLSTATYWLTRNKILSASCLLAGVLVDIDHLIEYGIYCDGKWDMNEFASGSYFDKKQTVKIIFHSWEAALILGIVSLYWCCLRRNMKKSSSILCGITIGYFLHLILDSYGNNLNKWGYFLLFRKKHQWRQGKLLDYDTKKVCL